MTFFQFLGLVTLGIIISLSAVAIGIFTLFIVSFVGDDWLFRFLTSLVTIILCFFILVPILNFFLKKFEN